jgi:hypothetical protein
MMTIKLRTLILQLSIGFINIGCGHHIYGYKPELVKHQSIQATSMLKTGMQSNEVKVIMGAEPIKIDKVGNTVVWQYCDTHKDKSDFVALFFKGEHNLLEKINYCTIFWQETKGIYYDGKTLEALFKQISCEYTVQKNGEKNPNNITLTLSDGSTCGTKEIKDQLKKEKFDQIGAALARIGSPQPDNRRSMSIYNSNQGRREQQSFDQQWQMRAIINPPRRR